jgi:transcriptional regulator with XRE-family HTH domain
MGAAHQLHRHPLRELRDGAGLSLRRVEAITSIDFRRLHLFECGLLPKADEVERLALVYRVPRSQLREVLGISEA